MIKIIQTIDDFITEYKKIKETGWIMTHRTGPTGIGKTLEDLLGIPENNHGEPDFGEYELKSTRMNSSSMLTMFTKSPEPARANTQLREKFGYASDAYSNNDKVLHSTLNAVRFVSIANTGRKLRISCASDRINIESDTGIEDFYWSHNTLKKTFDRKYKNKFIYAKAECRGDGRNEEFYFTEAYYVSGFDYDAMTALLEAGKIFVDLRIGQYADGRTHDHGTAFRIRECDQVLLFRKKVQLI